MFTKAGRITAGRAIDVSRRLRQQRSALLVCHQWHGARDQGGEFDADCPHRPIGNSVVRNKIPLASQTGQAFMVSSSSLAAGICLPW